MKAPVLVGENLRLAMLSENCAGFDSYLSWMRDVDSNPFILGVRKDYSPQNLCDYIESKNVSDLALFWGIYLAQTGELVGTIKLEPIDISQSLAWVGIMIGAPQNRGLGYGREAIKTVMNYSSSMLGLKCINLSVDTRNEPAVQLYKKLGFNIVKLEGGYATMTANLPSIHGENKVNT